MSRPSRYRATPTSGLSSERAQASAVSSGPGTEDHASQTTNHLREFSQQDTVEHNNDSLGNVSSQGYAIDGQGRASPSITMGATKPDTPSRYQNGPSTTTSEKPLASVQTHFRNMRLNMPTQAESAAPMQDSPSRTSNATNATSRKLSDGNSRAVPIRLPTQVVGKRLPASTTIEELIDALLVEYKFELETAFLPAGEPLRNGDILIWEVVDGLMRPTRNSELISQLCDTWRDERTSYLQAMPGSMRDEIGSLASLVPRRDILRSPPSLRNLMVFYRIPNPNKRSEGWSRGVLDVHNGNIMISARTAASNTVFFQKLMPISTTDIYSLASDDSLGQPAPAKLTVALRSQLPAKYFTDPNEVSVYVSMNGLGDFSLLRNIIFTLRSKVIEDINLKTRGNIKQRVASDPKPKASTPEVRNDSGQRTHPATVSRSLTRSASPRSTPPIQEPLMRIPSQSADPRIAHASLLGARYRSAGRTTRTSQKAPLTSAVKAAPDSLLARAQEADAFRYSPLSISSPPTK